VKYLVGLLQEMKPDGYNARYLNNRPTYWMFRLPKIEDATAVMNLIDIVLKLPHPLVSGSSCRIVIKIFGMNLSGFILTKADVCEVECKSFCHLRRTVKQYCILPYLYIGLSHTYFPLIMCFLMRRIHITV
jgi:hypothetical protein